MVGARAPCGAIMQSVHWGPTLALPKTCAADCAQGRHLHVQAVAAALWPEKGKELCL